MKVVGTSRSALAYRTWQLRPPRPSLTVVCKQTLALVADGPSTLSAEPVQCVAGAYHDDDPEQSLRYDDDLALFKPRGEWLLAGTCHPPRPTPTSAVGVRVGALAKRLAVFGDRHFTAMGLGISEPIPFTSMPLRWERSFGGPGVATNPLGRGIEPVDGPGGRRVPLPNIEDPAALIRGPSSRPPPFGAFPIPPTWRPRADLTGTYDERWRRTRWPYLPEDFAWEHFNAAPADQRASGYWRGDEAIVLENLVDGTATLRTRLVGVRPRLFLAPVGGDARALVEVRLNLDTITIDSDARQIYCAWRGLHELARDDLADIAAIFVVDDPLEAPRDRRAIEAEYQAILDAEAADQAAFELAPVPTSPRSSPASPASPPASAPPPPPRPASAAAPAAAPDPIEALQRLRAMYLAASLPIPAELERRLAESTLAREATAAPPPARPAPPPRDPQRAAAGRALLEAALRDGRSLAGLDLTEADLADLDLHGRDLRGAVLTRAILTRARLAAADLSKAALAEADLSDADLSGADLSDADLAGAHASRVRAARVRLRGALAGRADLSGADLAGADLSGADLSEADLAGADLSGARAHGVDLARASVSRATLARVDLREASIEGVDATALDLRGSVLTDIRADAGTRLDRADLRECDARGAHLAGASLVEANLTRVPLVGADLRGADLSRAHLAGADLEGARLEGARLAGASLLRADLAGAILTGADLEGADLRGACLIGAELWKARVDRARLDLADLRGTKLTGEGGRPR